MVSEKNTMKPLKGFNKRNGIIRFVPEELWTEVCDICTGGSDLDQTQEKEMIKGKMVV